MFNSFKSVSDQTLNVVHGLGDKDNINASRTLQNKNHGTLHPQIPPSLINLTKFPDNIHSQKFLIEPFYDLLLIEPFELCIDQRMKTTRSLGAPKK